MSSDNYIAVFSTKDMLGRDLRWYVAHGMMSNIETPDDENRWKKSIVDKADINKEWYNNREAALIAAHDLLKKEKENYNCPVVEYGVIEI